MTLREIADQAHRISHERPVRPKMLWVSPDIGHEVQRQIGESALDPATRYRVPGIHEPEGPHGMTLTIDQHLTAGVWRLADADGTLLYDCREGKACP